MSGSVSSVQSWRDDLAVLPREEKPWKPDRRGVGMTEEHVVIGQALRVIAKHAVEQGDRKMAGRVLAAEALSGACVAYVWQDCANLFPLPELPEDYGPTANAIKRGQLLDEQARAFFVGGVRGRPARLLRAEARGMLHVLRWLYRVGLLDSRTLTVADSDPWRRMNGMPAWTHPNIHGPLPPAAADLN